MGNILWKTETVEIIEIPDETDGVITNADITELLYSDEQKNINDIENYLGMSISDIHNKRSTNVLLNLCKEYKINFKELDVSKKEITELGYIFLNPYHIYTKKMGGEQFFPVALTF